MSSHDIEAGALWLNDILTALDGSSIGIICLTRENLAKPWVHFEAGALAKKIERPRVCSLLIDLAATDVGFPLAAFQTKTFSKEDV